MVTDITAGSEGPVEADTLIHGCDVVCLDGEDTLIRNGAIAIRGQRIVALGSAAELSERVAAGTRMSAHGQIAIPGLIDAHFHTGQQFLRSRLAREARHNAVRIPIWKNYYLPFEGMLDEEDVYLSGLVAYTSMLSLGTTCFAEAGGPHPDAMGRAAVDAGVRGFVALSTIDQGNGVPASMMMSRDEAYDRNVELVKRWRDGDRVRAWMALRQIIVCSPELIRAVVEAAREMAVKVHTHLCEGTYEIDYAMERFGRRPAEYLEEMEVLGPELHCAHSVLLSPPELDLYASRRPSACHCPLNNYTVGPARLVEMRRRGIDVGMGTDGAAAGGGMDLFGIARIAHVAQQAAAGTPWHDRGVTTREEMLRVVTNGGARALGLADEIGSLEVGRKADITLVDCHDVDHLLAEDPLFTVSHTTVGRDVRSVFVDGTLVMKDREILTVDMEALRARVEERWPRIMERFDTIGN